MQENQFQDRGNRENNAEIMWKVPFQNKNFCTKFHIKVRKLHSELRKALFKRSLE